MPSTDRDVFLRFFENPDISREVALIAYASFAAEKYEWIAHVEEREGEAPSLERVNSWIADLPDSRLAGFQDTSLTAFEIAAAAYMEPVMETAKKEAVDRSILAQVKRATSFWATFWPNLFTGVVASFTFAVLIILSAWVFKRDPTPFAFFK